MFVILSYDVDKKRAAKMIKTCRRYLVHVHKSVFEGRITEAELAQLKDDLSRVVVPEADSVRIWELASTRYAQAEDLGIAVDTSNVL